MTDPHLTALHRRTFGEPACRASSGNNEDGYENPAHGLSDEELVDRAKRAANGGKFARLWTGDIGDYRMDGNQGRSEADLALCSILAFWVGPDEERIDRLFRRSGLYRKGASRR